MRPVISALCEKIDRDPDGVMSLHRLIDQGTSETLPARFNLAAYFMIALDDHELDGQFDWAVRVVTPDGTGGAYIRSTSAVPPGHRHWVAGAQMPAVTLPVFGPYEFQLLVGEELISSVSFEVVEGKSAR